MEPNNIESQFREKLNEREIQPSAQAWDRLDAMLAVADSSHSEQAKQKPKRNYSWMFMAAAFLGFILITTVFLTQDQEMVDVGKDTIVFDIPRETIPNKNIQKPEALLEETESDVALMKNGDSNSNVSSKNDNIASTGKVSNTISKEAIIGPAVAEKQLPSETNDRITKPEEKLTNRYINVDELLASVDSPPTKEKVLDNVSKVKVNPNNLLSAVDGELELSFREKVIQSVSKNYQDVKVALGNRNLRD